MVKVLVSITVPVEHSLLFGEAGRYAKHLDNPFLTTDFKFTSNFYLITPAKVPSNRSKVPSNHSEVPSNRSEVPSNHSKVSSNHSEVSSNRSEVPSNRSKVSSDRSKGASSNSKALTVCFE